MSPLRSIATVCVKWLPIPLSIPPHGAEAVNLQQGIAPLDHSKADISSDFDVRPFSQSYLGRVIL